MKLKIFSNVRKENMNISVSGSRDFNDYDYVSTILNKLEINSVHVGDCKGVDKLVVKYCKENNIDCEIFEADWSVGLKAGPIRNEKMIEGTDRLIAFLKPGSKGTASAIKIATKKKIPVDILHIN